MKRQIEGSCPQTAEGALPSSAFQRMGIEV